MPLAGFGCLLQEVSLYSSGSDDDLVQVAPTIQAATSSIIIQAKQALNQVRVLYSSPHFCVHSDNVVLKAASAVMPDEITIFSDHICV